MTGWKSMRDSLHVGVNKKNKLNKRAGRCKYKWLDNDELVPTDNYRENFIDRKNYRVDMMKYSVYIGEGALESFFRRRRG
jgi:hypothetical protein